VETKKKAAAICFRMSTSSLCISVFEECEWRLVEYYDAETYSGETGPFRKPCTFAYQKEFRFIVQPGSSSPINLEIGSLADITSEVLPLTDINRLIDLY
jgi:hypothetical protein